MTKSYQRPQVNFSMILTSSDLCNGKLKLCPGNISTSSDTMLVFYDSHILIVISL
jgi:hypothetical protein